jgi:arylsulfatase A-like enzyme
MSTRREFLGLAAAGVAAAAAPRPNFLFLFPDQQRYDWTGLNRDLPLRTPHLDAIARRGAHFTRAVVASPLCAPSRACLASGMEYDRCGVVNNGQDFPLGKTTYYQLLRDSGYHVVGCGKLDLHKASYIWGLDGGGRLAEWGFSGGIDNAGKQDAIISGATDPKDPYMAFLHRQGLAQAHVEDFRKRKGYNATFPTPLPEVAYCDNWVGQNGLDLLRATPKDRPWHLVVNFTGPHSPMDITIRMDEICRNRDFPQPNGSKQYTAAEHVAIRQNYAAMIENIDRWTGVYVDELKRRGELDNTVIVYSSDHGEMLGDHDRWGKTYPWAASVGVPLVAAGPGVRRGLRSDALVSHIDIGATFLDYAGVAQPREMESRSLRPLLEGRTAKHRDVLRSGLNQWRMAWDGRYKLVTGFDPGARKKGEERAAPPTLLFDLESDPLENRNIAERAPEQVKRLRQAIG